MLNHILAIAHKQHHEEQDKVLKAEQHWNLEKVTLHHFQPPSSLSLPSTVDASLSIITTKSLLSEAPQSSNFVHSDMKFQEMGTALFCVKSKRSEYPSAATSPGQLQHFSTSSSSAPYRQATTAASQLAFTTTEGASMAGIVCIHFHVLTCYPDVDINHGVKGHGVTGQYPGL